MLRLQAEGMLRLYPKKGAMVVPVTAAEAENVIEARALIELWLLGAWWSRQRWPEDQATRRPPSGWLQSSSSSSS
jgi:DNA-binding GntR family transcriptional regulator